MAAISLPFVDGGWTTPRADIWRQYRRQLSASHKSTSSGRSGEHSRQKMRRSPHLEADGWKQPPSSHMHQPSAEASQRHRRPHVLHVELGKLFLNAAELGMELAWYESARYFVSLHPSSVPLPVVQWPQEAPRPKPHANYMASSAKTATAMPSGIYDRQESVEIQEKLEMQVDGLDSHFVLFLWCQRRSLLGESTVLLGYRPIPLRDSSLYSRWAAWDISDLEAAQELATISLCLRVTAPPAQIRLAHLSDVRETGFTLNWSEPLGSPATAYAVSIHAPGAAVALWRKMTSDHEVSLGGLLPGKTYMVDITGLNQAGWGDGLTLEASTRATCLDLDAETEEERESDELVPQANRHGVTHL